MEITKGGKMTIGHEHMMVYAARYAHGRNTGAALQIVSHILAEWDKLTENTKWKLYKDTREARYCQEDWQKLRDRYEDEHQCCNCVYEIYQGSMPSCAHDMKHGEACRFFNLVDK